MAREPEVVARRESAREMPHGPGYVLVVVKGGRRCRVGGCNGDLAFLGGIFSTFGARSLTGVQKGGFFLR